MSEPVSKEIDDRPVVAVANRLPVQHGEHGWELSPGGLVTALRPVMSTPSGAWVGWGGGAQGHPVQPAGLRGAAAADQPVVDSGPQLLLRLLQRDVVAAAALRDRET